MARKELPGVYHQNFANELIDRIKAGTAPWQKPWKAGQSFLPENLSTGKAYKGSNSLYLTTRAMDRGFGDNRWGTFRQVKNLGGSIQKGAKGEKIVFWDRIGRVLEREKDGRPKRDAEGNPVYRHFRRPRPLMRVYTVFNAGQTRGLDLARETPQQPAWHTDRVAEAVIRSSQVDIRHVQGDRAYYHLKRDQVVLPPREQFPNGERYYATTLHELGHATGHPDRLDRETLQAAMKGGFGSPDYAREELRAEISAMMTAGRLKIAHQPRHGAAYVAGWVEALENDPREIHHAAKTAQRISDHLIDLSRDRLQDIDRAVNEDRAVQRQPEITPGRGPNNPNRTEPQRSGPPLDRQVAMSPSR